MADTPNAADKVEKGIEAKLNEAPSKIETANIDTAIKEAKALKGGKDMPD